MLRRNLATPGLLCAFAACAPEPTSRPNVILVSIDTLRADHVGAYGYERDTTPFLDEFAQQGLLFERAFTPASWTLTAHATMLSGLQPDEHGLTTDGLAFSHEVPLLAERLGNAGYRTVGLYLEGWINKQRGFGRGFDVFEDHENAEQAGEHLHAALATGNGEQPLFLFLHLFDVHSRPFLPDSNVIYDAPEPYGSYFLGPESAPLPDLPAEELWEKGLRLDDAQLATLVARYDGAIRYVDAKLAEWFAELERRGLLENALVIVTADHGEALGQRGRRLKGHGGSYQEALHVPLLVRLPGEERAGERNTTPVQSGDIVPTVLDLCGLPTDPRLGGVSLRGALPTERIIDGSRQGSRYAVRWPEKYVDIGKGKILHTDLAQDPRELANREVDGTELRRLVELARGGRGPYPAPIPMGAASSEDEKRLRDLGYGGELDETR